MRVLWNSWYGAIHSVWVGKWEEARFECKSKLDANMRPESIQNILCSLQEKELPEDDSIKRRLKVQRKLRQPSAIWWEWFWGWRKAIKRSDKLMEGGAEELQTQYEVTNQKTWMDPEEHRRPKATSWSSHGQTKRTIMRIKLLSRTTSSYLIRENKTGNSILRKVSQGQSEEEWRQNVMSRATGEMLMVRRGRIEQNVWMTSLRST